jgi:hypothetical protein
MTSVLGDIVAAVACGAVRRPPLEELSGYEYFVDAEGRVYSMNNEEPRIVDAKTEKGGLEVVVLMTRDGWRRYFVGELVAEAFLAEQRPGVRAEYTVVHIDGDTRNNAAPNLRWVTKLEANRYRQNVSRSRHEPRTAVVQPVAARQATVAVPTADHGHIPIRSSVRTEEDSRETLKLIERNQRTQQRLEEITSEHQRLMAALTPFAEIAESAELRVAHPDKVVLETNKGRPSYKRVTAGDFRRALEVMRELARGTGS